MGVVWTRLQSMATGVSVDESAPCTVELTLPSPWLLQFLSRALPTTWETHNDVLLQLAHVPVWKCNASIRGGFVRDWIVRGEPANDIDVQLAPPTTTQELLEKELAAFLAQSPSARAKALRISRWRTMGAVLSLTISGVASPGVDCDAGNLLANRTELLLKKIHEAGDSLSGALENTRQKRFPFNAHNHGETNATVAAVSASFELLPRAHNALERAAMERSSLLSPLVRLWSLVTRGRPETTPPQKSLRWRPSGDGNGPKLVVAHGDLTTCAADAIVNPANSDLVHGGGVAGAIARKGGHVIDDESKAWIEKNKQLPVGHAMSTRSGELPCRYVIHTVGPMVGGGGFKLPTDEQAQQLRDAVRSALQEADKLQLSSIAMPGISSGIFGFPLELAATEIVGECVRFACEKAASTTLTTIMLMNIDVPTCQSFALALREAAQLYGRGEVPEYVLRDHLLSSGNDDKPVKLVETEPEKEMDSVPSLKATAVLPVRVGETDFEILLGIKALSCGGGTLERRCVSVLGNGDGRSASNQDDDDVMTACRRFSEDIGGVLPVDSVVRAMNEASRTLVLESGLLHLVRLDRQYPQDLPHAYDQWRMKAWCSPATNDRLVWIPWRSLKTATSTTAAERSLSNRSVRTLNGVFPLSSAACQMIQECHYEIERELESLLLPSALQRELLRVQTLKGMTNEELIATVLGRDWELHLASPQLPPPSQLELLSPTDPLYTTLLDELPVDIATRVVSMRRVRSSARHVEYEKTKREITDPYCKEMEPLFHGTSARWRATAIALHGFDLSIRLNGRSHGDGVYTATNVFTADSYSRGTGSLLRLRGLVASNCTAGKEHNTIIRGEVYVFPNPKTLLPLAIVDYAAEDQQDLVEAQRRRIQNGYVQLLQHRRAVEVAQKTEETEFMEAMGVRLQAALKLYADSIMTRSREIGEVAAPNRSPSRQFFQERRHFEQCLPVYEVKPALVQLLRTTPITVIVADTGSGKSTQLPQILLDDVLSTTETRRIAILEPRRINAISLSKRVSEERGSVQGQEVGYTIGRGDSTVSLGVTRLEYMTHGLFVQLARDPAYLVKHYCAVIVDEAHERSVDVGLSLALLQRVLKQQQQSGDSFRVIVTSATIEEEAQKIQRYLDPSLQHSAVFRVHGRTFPVYVEHRNDIQVDRSALGTATVGKVLTSAAIQSAVELLRTTEKGNILVFLPGEGSINEALAVAQSEIAMSATVETVDTFSSGSSAFCFRMSTLSAGQQDDYDDDSPSSMQRNIVTTYVVGFHGKITRAERDRVLHPWDLHTRWVVFTTNIAETGVTLPNVRYVIDTGLERRVRWNATLDMNEMVTAPISKSSMAQRAGRAGRTASGICIRLYPDEAAGEITTPAVVPAVQNAMIYKAVLLMKELESRGEESLELLDPIESKTWAQAQQRLVALDALDPDDATLTQEGAALLRLGIDLRLGRFLIACARFGCLATGVKLVSLLVNANAPERLLPMRDDNGHTERIKSLIDPSGDHLTLLNVFEAYEMAHHAGRGIDWCRQLGFPYDVFVEADVTRDYLLKVLDELDFSIMDDLTTTAPFHDKRARVRKALCAAYHDQLARPRLARTAAQGFVRVLDKATPPQHEQNARSKDGGIREKPLVMAGSSSTMWLPVVSGTLVTTEELVVFGSVVLTDSSSACDPTVFLLTHVTAHDVKAGASESCRLKACEIVAEEVARKTLVVDLPGSVGESFVAHRVAWLNHLSRELGSSVAATIRDKKLHVTCPQRSHARVEYHLRKSIQSVTPESVVIQLPRHVDIDQLIDDKGKRLAALRTSVEVLLSSEHDGAGLKHVHSRLLAVDVDQKTVTVTLQGASKAMMSVVVGRVQSVMTNLLGAQTLPVVLTLSSGYRPRLAQLLNPTPPTKWHTRDDVILQLAHALVWGYGASLHGGFVRDWVVRGDAATEIDVLLTSPLTTEASIKAGLTDFWAKSPGVSSEHGLQIWSKTRPKGVKQTLVITGSWHSLPIDVVLEDNHLSKTLAVAPGVDCDAGNLLLNRTESLRKKIVSVGASLTAALENIQHKRFVFYCSLDQAASVARLRKYLERGWTCLSHVPADVQLTDRERALIRPVANANHETGDRTQAQAQQANKPTSQQANKPTTQQTSKPARMSGRVPPSKAAVDHRAKQMNPNNPIHKGGHGGGPASSADAGKAATDNRAT